MTRAQAEIDSLTAKNTGLRLALESWKESFERDIASDNFVCEDRHEAMRLTEKALAVKPEGKP